MNIRAGLTTERALILTARPEFGILERELKRAGKEILAGTDLKEAMGGISKRIKSRQLETTLRLIVDGIRSGGELASLLEQTASDIRNTSIMEKEVKANVMMYVIFIFFAVGLGAPLIFGISTHLVEVLTEQMSHFEGIDLPSYEDIKTKGVMPFGTFSGIQGITSVSIDPEFLILFAIMSMLMTSFFGGLIIGIIKDGEEKYGAKYIPVLMTLSIVIFFVTRIIAATVFAL
jgi:flagellar protein FlaJ